MITNIFHFCINFLIFPQVDQIIQDALFKAQDEDAQVTALLGFVDVQELFDKRVKKLFENDLQCPDEVDTIKKQFM